MQLCRDLFQVLAARRWGNTRLWMLLALVGLCCASAHAQVTLPTLDVGASYSVEIVISGASDLPKTQCINASGATPPGMVVGLIGQFCYFSGAPTATGTYTFFPSVTDNTGNTGSGTAWTITINAAMQITTSTLPSGVINASYSASIGRTGGTPNYSWSAFNLPSGISINTSTGALSGSPTQSGNFSPVISVGDGGSGFVQKTLSLFIATQLTITNPTSLAPGVAGSNYTAVTFLGSGGLGTYTWSVSGQPSGMSINSSSGSFGGVPASAGTYQVKVTLNDPNGDTTNVTLPLTINPVLSITSPSSLPSGVYNQPYSPVTFTAAGGTLSGYSWSSSGQPAGMSINSSTGAFGGTPTATCTCSVTVTVTDSGQHTSTVVLPLAVNYPPVTVTNPSSLPSGLLNTIYGSVTFTATGGTGTGFTWSSTGQPAGMSINASTGVFSGTPTATCTCSVVVTVKDSLQHSGTITLSLTIGFPTVTINSPTSFAPGVFGSPYTPVTFTATGGTGSGYSWSSSGQPAGLSINSTTGVFGGTPTVAGTFPVVVTVMDSLQHTGTSNLSLTINYPTLTITKSTLPVGFEGQDYGPAALLASGGTGTGFTWTMSGQPNGLVIGASSGVITGKPAVGTHGSYTITANVTDSASHTASAQLSLTVNVPSISITQTTLPAATEGAAYAALTFTATGGTGTGYTWSAIGQPAGLSINANTGAFGGTPAFGTSSGSPYTVKVTVTDSGGTSTFVQIPLTVNVAPATGISLSSNSLSFTYIPGGAIPGAQSFGVLGTGGQTSYTVSASATGGSGNWLAASPATGQTPGNVTVSLQNLSSFTTGGAFQGTVTVKPQGSLASQSLSVTLTVLSPAAVLSLSSTDVRFTVATGGTATGAIQVSNTGGGSLGYSVNVTPAPWLSITCGSQGSATAANPGLICLQLNSAGLQAGTFSAKVAVVAGSQEADAIVTLQVNGSATSIVLSATAMSFTSISGAPGVFPASQSSAVLNSGSATMNWTAQIDPSTPAPWLNLSTGSGSSLPFGGSQPGITFTPNATGLSVGNHYAVVNIAVPDGSASNSPAQITVLVKVLPAGSALPPGASTSGLIFTAPVGGAATAAQPLTLINPTGGQVSFNCLLATGQVGGKQIADWLSGPPAAGTVPSSGNFPMTVQVNPTGLAAGTYYSQLRLGFSNGTFENVDVVMVVTPLQGSAAISADVPGGALQPNATSGTCTTSGLSFAQSFPTDGATIVAGQSYVLQLNSLCVPNPTNLLKPEIDFSTNGFVGPLTPVFNSSSGFYEVSWTPDPRAAGSTVTFAGQANPVNSLGAPVAGAAQTGVFKVIVANADPNGSAIPQGVSNSAFAATVNSVAGGSFISIYGKQIANTATTATTVPFNPILGGIKVTLAGTALPLYYADSGQVNAIVPFLGNQFLNTTQSLVVYKNCSSTGTGCIPASPLSLNMLAIQPGIFPYPAAGDPPNQGAIQNASISGSPVADPSHPAKVGDTIVIYGAGLGQVDNPPAAGAVTPGVAHTLATPTVFIDGIQAAKPAYSGLTPGSVDLYQVNVVVPAGIHSGTVKVYMTMPDQTGNLIPSNVVTIN